MAIIMKSRIIGYRMKIDTLLAQPPEDVQWEPILQTFAILTMIAFAIYCIAEYIPVLALIALLLVLLVPYIGHYYTLENEVQKMYRQYDEILRRVKRET